MDSDSLVDWRIDAGQRVIRRLVQDGFNVDAAFWTRTADDACWILYIASPVVEAKGPAGAYRDLQASLQHLEGIPVSLSDVTLIGREDPITRDVTNLLTRHPGRLPIRFGGKRLGHMIINDAYIYPVGITETQTPGSMTRDQVLQELFRLMTCGTSSVAPSKIVLKNGSTFTGAPFSIQSDRQRPVIIQFVADGELAPRVLGIDEIASIQ
jgi:hypothetical protein